MLRIARTSADQFLRKGQHAALPRRVQGVAYGLLDGCIDLAHSIPIVHVVKGVYVFRKVNDESRVSLALC